jgi:hypothetical protein
MIELIRYCYASKYTLGFFETEPGETFYTVERPWLNNAPNVSCIPEGRYVCLPYNSPRFPNTLQVKNVANRTHILFHAGNTSDDVKGCIALGLTSNPSGVVNSRKAMEKFRERFCDGKQHELLIRHFDPTRDIYR